MKIIIFSPFFGKLPNYFQLWLNSVKNNKNIDVRFFTDNDLSQYIIPKNVYVTKISFLDFIKKIQLKFDFEIKIKNPYKLCDIKPMYGYIFEEDTENYDFWGHADIDFIFGDLSSFITKIHLLREKKIFRNGHFSIYKNTREVNRYFKKKIHKIDYKFVLSNLNYLSFDELPKFSINSIFDYLKEPVYHKNDLIADIHPLYKSFKLCHLDYLRFSYNNIKVDYLFEYKSPKIFGFYLENNQIKKKEFLYLHMQKRNFKNSLIDEENFFIIPDEFVNNLNVNINLLKKVSSKKIKVNKMIKSKINSLKYLFLKNYLLR